MPISDSQLVARSSTAGSLTATEVSSAFDLGGTPIEGLALYVLVPVVDTATDQTLDVYIRASTGADPATTDPIIATLNDLEGAAGEYVLPFSTNKRSVDVEFAVAGTSPDFSVVTAYIVEQVQHTWTRAVEWTT